MKLEVRSTSHEPVAIGENDRGKGQWKKVDPPGLERVTAKKLEKS
jgi:hypothetical protein